MGRAPSESSDSGLTLHELATGPSTTAAIRPSRSRTVADGWIAILPYISMAIRPGLSQPKRKSQAAGRWPLAIRPACSNESRMLRDEAEDHDVPSGQDCPVGLESADSS